MHNHDHNHDHNHNHDHKHSHSPQTDRDRIKKIITHWLKHNDDHISNYKEWAYKARFEKLPDVSELLIEIADMSQAMNKKFQKALTFLE
ncbi:hypothetical protein MHK_007776 [Candidatus Magnetomorum sp. HK-1]|nr:hypothetical protein MHK_007776 [Candidatus Magnetomorum sp. HK-1]